MEKLSSKVLPLERWSKVKEDLQCYWIKEEELACCFYCKDDEPAFSIFYNPKTHSLDYYACDNQNNCPLFTTYFWGFGDKKIQNLISPNHLIEVIDEFYRNEGNENN